MHEKRMSLGFDLGNCFKSCTLHVREALYNSQKLEDCLETLERMTSQDREELTESASRILHHLSSAKSCIRHSEILLEKLNPSLSKDNSELVVCPVDNPLPVNIGADISLNDYIPQDEIYELYCGNEELPKMSYDESQEEHTVASQCSAVVMNELKGVLKIRAEDWKEREEKVRRRQIAEAILDDKSEGNNLVVNEGVMFSEPFVEHGGEGTAAIGQESKTSLSRVDRHVIQEDKILEEGGSSDSTQESKEKMSVLDRLEYVGGYISCLLPVSKEIDSGSRESAYSTRMGDPGLGVRALAAEAVAKVRSNKQHPLIEEEFVFIGEEED